MEEITVGAGIGALGLWLFVAACVSAVMWDGIRKREAQHETLRRMIESGQPIDPTLRDRLLGTNKRPDRELLVWGVVSLFTAPGLAMLGWFASYIAHRISSFVGSGGTCC